MPLSQRNTSSFGVPLYKEKYGGVQRIQPASRMFIDRVKADHSHFKKGNTVQIHKPQVEEKHQVQKEPEQKHKVILRSVRRRHKSEDSRLDMSAFSVEKPMKSNVASQIQEWKVKKYSEKCCQTENEQSHIVPKLESSEDKKCLSKIEIAHVKETEVREREKVSKFSNIPAQVQPREGAGGHKVYGITSEKPQSKEGKQRKVPKVGFAAMTKIGSKSDIKDKKLPNFGMTIVPSSEDPRKGKVPKLGSKPEKVQSAGLWKPCKSESRSSPGHLSKKIISKTHRDVHSEDQEKKQRGTHNFAYDRNMLTFLRDPTTPTSEKSGFPSSQLSHKPSSSPPEKRFTDTPTSEKSGFASGQFSHSSSFGRWEKRFTDSPCHPSAETFFGSNGRKSIGRGIGEKLVANRELPAPGRNGIGCDSSTADCWADRREINANIWRSDGGSVPYGKWPPTSKNPLVETVAPIVSPQAISGERKRKIQVKTMDSEDHDEPTPVEVWIPKTDTTKLRQLVNQQRAEILFVKNASNNKDNVPRMTIDTKAGQGRLKKAIITSVQSLDNIFIRPKDDVKDARSFLDKLNKDYDIKSEAETWVEREELNEGSYYVAKCTSLSTDKFGQERWNRCLLLKRNEHSALMQFIDFGFIEHVPLEGIHPLIPGYMTQTALCFGPCILFGMDRAKDYADGLIKIKQLLSPFNKKRRIHVEKNTTGRSLVTLYKRIDGNQVDINGEILNA